MLRPFTAYLRVYEPLSAFGDPPDERLVKAVESVESRGLARSTVGEREHLMWLKSQFATPPRLLPAELADGRPAPSGITDVLVVHPSDVPRGKGVRVGPGPLVSPLELRSRSAVALVRFLDEGHPALQSAVLDAARGSMRTVRTRAASALSDSTNSAMHVLSVPWTIPLPWFTLVDPAEGRLVLGSGPEDPEREMSWRVAMKDALRRVALARDLTENLLGDEGPTRMLIDTERWLTAFHPHSAVELDYGGLVQLLGNDALEADTTAQDVHDMLDALRDRELEQVADLLRGLREFWYEMAVRERCN